MYKNQVMIASAIIRKYNNLYIVSADSTLIIIMSNDKFEIKIDSEYIYVSDSVLISEKETKIRFRSSSTGFLFNDDASYLAYQNLIFNWIDSILSSISILKVADKL